MALYNLFSVREKKQIARFSDSESARKFALANCKGIVSISLEKELISILKINWNGHSEIFLENPGHIKPIWRGNI